MKTSRRQNIPNPIPLARNALFGSYTVAVGASIVTAYEFYEAVTTQVWQLYVMGASTFLLLSVALWSAWLNRRGNPTLGMGTLFLIAPVVFISHTILATNLALALGIGALGIAITGAPVVLPHKYYPRVLFIGVLTSYAILIADRLHLPFSVTTFEPLSLAILVGVSCVVLMNIILLAFQFRIHPLRNKIILAVTILAAFAASMVAAVSLNSSREALHQTADLALNAAASQAASNLEYFFSSNLEAVEREAQLPVIRTYLSTPSDQHTPEIQNELVQTINALMTKEVRVNATETTSDAYLLTYSLLDVEGRVVFDSTPANMGQNWSDRDYFRTTFGAEKPFVSDIEFVESSQAWLHFGARVLNHDRPVGVLVVRYNALILQRIVGENQNLQGLAGANSFAMLLDENYLHLAHGQSAERPLFLYQTSAALDAGLVDELQAAGRLPRTSHLSANFPGLANGLVGAVSSPAFTYSDPQNVEYIASAVRLKTEPWWVVYAQPEIDLFAAVQEQLNMIQLVALMVTGVAALAAILLTAILSAPVTRLTRFTEAVISGDMNVRAVPESNDEVGDLAMAFNSMTEQLQNMIANLEHRVEDRTLELQQRSAYLEASAIVSQATASILNPEQLIQRAVDLIQDRFELYYVGLFIIDEPQEFALLRAGTGEPGKRMLDRGHRLRLDEHSMIGWSVTHVQARIALQVGEDPIRLATSELPETRSEAAIPLRSRGRVLGAITVQSTKPNAFDPDMIAVLQIMADQVAVALDNARLFADSQAALEATRRVYGDVSRQAWQELLSYRPDLGFVSVEGGVHLADDLWMAEADQAFRKGETVFENKSISSGNRDSGEMMHRSPLAVPIKVRGNVVGVLDTYKSGDDAEWTPEEIATIEAITEQLSVALDSARLYSQTQLQAERQRMVAEITTHMRETLDVETVLKTAAQDIYEALGLHDVVIRLENPDQA